MHSHAVIYEIIYKSFCPDDMAKNKKYDFVHDSGLIVSMTSNRGKGKTNQSAD